MEEGTDTKYLSSHVFDEGLTKNLAESTKIVWTEHDDDLGPTTDTMLC